MAKPKEARLTIALYGSSRKFLDKLLRNKVIRVQVFHRDQYQRAVRHPSVAIVDATTETVSV